MDLFVPQSWDNPDDPECVGMRKKTYMPAAIHYRAKWQMALDLIDQVRSDGVHHRAVVADSWYGDITDFRQGLDDRKERYIVGVYADTQVFLESPAFVQPEPQEKKRGRKRKHPNLIETNPLPVKISELGKCVADGDWEHLEIWRDCLDKPLVKKWRSLKRRKSVKSLAGLSYVRAPLKPAKKGGRI